MADTAAVLRRIANVVETCGRNIIEGHDLTSVVTDLNTCKANLQRIAEAISADIYRSIEESIDSLLRLARQSDGHAVHASAASVQPNILTAGRPTESCE